MKKIVALGLLAISLAVCFLGAAPLLNAANANPTWYVDARCFTKSGTPGAFDEVAVKDPSIVYWGGKYHLFYTGVTNAGWWQMGYSSAASIEGLAGATHHILGSIKENYFCAPQVFYFEPHEKWYMIYNSGRGATYTTTTDITDPNSWTFPRAMGINSGYDYWVICDDTYAYIFWTQDGTSRNILWSRTALANFPFKWSKPFLVAVSDTFEGVCVYKSLADGKYYMLPEDLLDNRYYELWTAEDLSGPWTQVAEQWASRHNLIYNADRWTEDVSHGKIIRAGYNQKLEINDIDRVDFLIQGVKSGSYKDYAHIPWDLGIIRNYKNLFSDGFESGNLAKEGWNNRGCAVTTSCSNAGKRSAVFNAKDMLTKAVSTVGYGNIKVSYARSTRNCEKDDYFICEWYNGSDWTMLETVAGNSDWTVRTFTLPADAENNANFRIRFRTGNNSFFDYAYLDEVAVSAGSGPKPSPVPASAGPVPTTTSPPADPAPAAIEPSGAKYEAENAVLSGTAYVATDHTGYSGSGFVAGLWGSGTGQAVTFNVNVSSAGTRTVTLRYANAMGSAQNISIYVNGVHVKDSSHPNLANWDTWGTKTESLTLKAGSNTITYRKDPGDGCINFDYITVE